MNSFDLVSLGMFVYMMWPRIHVAILAWLFFTLFLKPDDWKF